jgi:hypothetical protein
MFIFKSTLLMNRKRLSELTRADLLENEVWEYCMADNIEYVSPSGKVEVNGDSNEVYIVITDFIFKNNSKHVGYCSPHTSGSLGLVQPVVLTDKGPVEFYREADFTPDDETTALSRFGLRKQSVFPVEYISRIKCNREYFSGMLLDFNRDK